MAGFLTMVSVYDTAADTFSPPQFVPSKGVAQRMFSDEVNRADPQNALYNHPQDFHLYFLGEFEQDVGVFHPAKELFLRAVDVKVKPQ